MHFTTGIFPITANLQTFFEAYLPIIEEKTILRKSGRKWKENIKIQFKLLFGGSELNVPGL